MALELNKELDSGGVAQYHKIERVAVSIDNNDGDDIQYSYTVTIASYFNKDSRDSGKQPMQRAILTLPNKILSDLSAMYEELKSMSQWSSGVDV
jgi:hypothetical protein